LSSIAGTVTAVTVAKDEFTYAKPMVISVFALWVFAMLVCCVFGLMIRIDRLASRLDRRIDRMSARSRQG
jgi:hypothetical protein